MSIFYLQKMSPFMVCASIDVVDLLFVVVAVVLWQKTETLTPTYTLLKVCGHHIIWRESKLLSTHVGVSVVENC